MTKRIFKSIFSVTLVMVLTSLTMMVAVLYNHFEGIEQERLVAQTQLGAHGVSTLGQDYLKELNPKGYRVTWVNADGSVLYDSEVDINTMENHGNREEIQEALDIGYGESSRSSTTLLENQLYAAQKLPDGTVLRISNTQKTMLAFLFPMLPPIFLVLMVAVVLSLILASRLSKGIIHPLNNLDLDTPLANDSYEEISPLLTRIERQHQKISHQIKELKHRQNEFEAITENMVEGLILLNEKGIILSINHSATKIFETDMDCIGKDMLTVNRSMVLQELLTLAMCGTHGEKLLPLSDGTYQIGGSPILSDGDVLGVVLLMFDVTAKVNGEKMRKEFTANVSHELKTPLHSISGCAELLKNDMVNSEDISKFTNQIYNETQRMIILVDDIIGLSHLDEGADTESLESVNLTELVCEVVSNLMHQAKARQIELEFDHENKPMILLGIPRILIGLIYNLCDNGIKYNQPNGKVVISLKEKEAGLVLCVSDTGIGISEAHKSRIFERFYRVDKSRSKDMGGTGLGLSIVKHAATLHQAELSVESVVGSGTTITVSFKR